MKISRNKFIQVLKWLWIIAVFAFASIYIKNHLEEISFYLSVIPVWRLFVTLLLLLCGKLCLALLSKYSVDGLGWFPTYKQMLPIYATTQLGKYIPGGIWHFVGKFGVYRAKGMSNEQTTKALVVENAWILGSAFSIGISTILLSDNEIMYKTIGIPCQPGLIIAICIALPLVWILLATAIEKVVFQDRKGQIVVSLIKILSAQIMVWMLLGISLWFLFPELNLETMGLAIGAFSVSWAIGYSTVFAPGGIGIREIVLTALLGNFFPVQQIVTYAAVHRVLWTAAEVALGLASGLLFGFPKFENNDEEENLKITNS